MTTEEIDAEFSRRLSWMKARNLIDVYLLDPMNPMPRDYYRDLDAEEERENGWTYDQSRGQP